jgi:hypothetical protein
LGTFDIEGPLRAIDELVRPDALTVEEDHSTDTQLHRLNLRRWRQPLIVNETEPVIILIAGHPPEEMPDNEQV